MLHVIQSDVSPLRDRLACRNTNGHILKFLVAREFGKPQWLVESCLRGVREAEGRCLCAIGVEADHRDGTALCEASGAASVGAETVPEAGKVEGRDARASHELDVSVQSDAAQLEKVDWTSSASLMRGGVRYNRSCSRDRLQDNSASILDSVIESYGEQLWRHNTGFEIVECIGVSSACSLLELGRNSDGKGTERQWHKFREGVHVARGFVLL